MCANSREAITQHSGLSPSVCGDNMWVSLGLNPADGPCSVGPESSRGSVGLRDQERVFAAYWMNRFINKYYDVNIYLETNQKSVQGLYDRSRVISPLCLNSVSFCTSWNWFSDFSGRPESFASQELKSAVSESFSVSRQKCTDLQLSSFSVTTKLDQSRSHSSCLWCNVEAWQAFSRVTTYLCYYISASHLWVWWATRRCCHFGCEHVHVLGQFL